MKISIAIPAFDDGTGQIDYDAPLNNHPIRIWPGWQDKGGLGMSRFGFSDFGFEGDAAVGLGRGCFGNSYFGFDADKVDWTSRPLPTGAYKFAVKITDGRGNETYSSEIGPITVIPAIKPAEQLCILSFDEQSNQIVFGIS